MPGFTCAVPGCFNNSARDKQFSYYRFPHEEQLRKLWVLRIKRQGGLKGRFSDFQPTNGHRVCSAHFEGGKKTPFNELPTIFPICKTKQAVRRKNAKANRVAVPQAPESVIDRLNEAAYEMKYTYKVSDSKDHMYALDCEESDLASMEQILKKQMNSIADMETEFQRVLKNKMDIISEMKTVISKIKENNTNVVSDLESQIEVMKEELMRSKREISHLKYELKVSRSQTAKVISQKKCMQATSHLEMQEVKKKLLSVESLKTSEEMLKFYTGFSNFSEFQMLVDFMKEDQPIMMHWGLTESLGASGKKRTKFHLSPESSLLIVLARLKNGLLEQDLAYRFGVSPSTISRVWRTYLELLYRRLSQIPIWLCREVAHQHENMLSKKRLTQSE